MCEVSNWNTNIFCRDIVSVIIAMIIKILKPKVICGNAGGGGRGVNVQRELRIRRARLTVNVWENLCGLLTSNGLPMFCTRLEKQLLCYYIVYRFTSVIMGLTFGTSLEKAQDAWILFLRSNIRGRCDCRRQSHLFERTIGIECCAVVFIVFARVLNIFLASFQLAWQQIFVKKKKKKK